MLSRRCGLGAAVWALVSLRCRCSPLPPQVFYQAADGATYGPFPAESVEAWYREGYFPPETPVAPSEAGPFVPLAACLHEGSENPLTPPAESFEEEPAFPEEAELLPQEHDYPPYSSEGAEGGEWAGRAEVPEAPRRKRSVWR